MAKFRIPVERVLRETVMFDVEGHSVQDVMKRIIDGQLPTDDLEPVASHGQEVVSDDWDSVEASDIEEV